MYVWMGFSEIQVDSYPLPFRAEEIKPVDLVSPGKVGGREGGWVVWMDRWF